MSGARVLVVEDAAEYAQLITAALRQDGHTVSGATTIDAARTQLRSSKPDVVVLDLTLPDGDGLDLCQEIRATTNAFVLVLTGRDDEVDKLVGFRLGADDYMTKPFSPRELAARIRALVGRSRPRDGDDTTSMREIGTLTLDVEARTVTVRDRKAELTKIEFDLLDALTRRPGAVLSRLQLLEAVWGTDYIGDDHVVDVHIANLRKKIDDDSTNHIRTVRGVGYAANI
jgi:DNA-binding response OmpR family regulator